MYLHSRSNTMGSMFELFSSFIIYLCLLQGLMSQKTANVSVQRGDSATLRCNLPDPQGTKVYIQQVEWSRCDKNIIFISNKNHGNSSSSNYTQRLFMISFLELAIMNVASNDTGEYCCSLTTFPLGKYESKIILEVKDPPAVTGLPNWSLLYIIAILLGILLLIGGITWYLLHVKKHRKQIRNLLSTHVAIHKLSVKHPQPPSSKTPNSNQNKVDDAEDLSEDGTEYFNILSAPQLKISHSAKV
ncbi:uncharacterized protein LOC120523109 [Polypterus senegalus]|uniref:uncharacterized protein LOC120523109 n=1 Tax=Polypterus senegalus TaxID=55291 RepID=UPI0019639967|nr:uncharacterized protein LOC120523109 [Polypterus senegalus]